MLPLDLCLAIVERRCLEASSISPCVGATNSAQCFRESAAALKCGL